MLNICSGMHILWEHVEADKLLLESRTQPLVAEIDTHTPVGPTISSISLSDLFGAKKLSLPSIDRLLFGVW